MYRGLAILLFCCLFIRLQSPKDVIRWGSKEITWEDFKGIPDPRLQSAANTLSILHIELDAPTSTSATVMIEALFDTNKSWVREKRDALLEHEKGHFDIAELYARKMRKELTATSFKNSTYENEVFAFYYKMNAEMDKYQDLYDRETDFSRNVEKQQHWMNNLQMQLKLLEEYSSLVVVLNVDWKK